MNELTSILESVKEQNLSRGLLELYEQKLSDIYADMMIEIGNKKKERALFFLERQRPEVTDISIRRLWDAGTSGQKLIELEANVKAVSRILSSVKARIYQSY